MSWAKLISISNNTTEHYQPLRNVRNTAPITHLLTIRSNVQWTQKRRSSVVLLPEIHQQIQLFRRYRSEQAINRQCPKIPAKICA